MPNETAWRQVDDYFCSTLLPTDPVLEQALRDSRPQLMATEPRLTAIVGA